MAESDTNIRLRCTEEKGWHVTADATFFGTTLKDAVIFESDPAFDPFLQLSDCFHFLQENR